MRITRATRRVMEVLMKKVTDSHYGLEIMKETNLPSGTVYPILHRLEAAGWLSASWEDIDPEKEGRPPRKQYTVTGEGAREMAAVLTIAAAKVRPNLAGGYA